MQHTEVLTCRRWESGRQPHYCPMLASSKGTVWTLAFSRGPPGSAPPGWTGTNVSQEEHWLQAQGTPMGSSARGASRGKEGSRVTPPVGRGLTPLQSTTRSKVEMK